MYFTPEQEMVCTPFNNININDFNPGITTMSWVKREGKALIFMFRMPYIHRHPSQKETSK